ncbi:symmetrical bis(5'-nucleosyl)-tetraphosphatase [Legionella yabuuchiae]|uniref:symmetrical bis(5'-nucleosyl)-tetraphosphatase n=1 Tax=Legionella yabuuchiae TaxID=376727 RepID=UPI0010551DC8|nr:symmetrical bis(5'-nucleosyl)-tetraphosphatase [Legionella yabuuchiae]
MADYAIGDIQGCYDPLMRLLDLIQFDEHEDRLWFAGDLVNRGPQSLAVLRFVRSLPQKTHLSLGNHDLHLLSRLFSASTWSNDDDTLKEIEEAEDAEELGYWLKNQSILCYDESLNVVMTHAGIAPMWDLDKAIALAKELEAALQGNDFHDFLTHMYGNKPDYWSDELSGYERLRAICNYFTRMRMCDEDGRLIFHYKGTLQDAPKYLYPWYNVPGRKEVLADVVFGHWAALMGISPDKRLHPIDTGCLWGGQLTALRLQDKKRFAVPGMASSV